jgi:DNA-binding CsgD family transcriptional regulator
MTMETTDLENEIKLIISEDKIACKDALELARKLNIAPGAVGKEINRLKIKIKSCQLGCFK